MPAELNPRGGGGGRRGRRGAKVNRREKARMEGEGGIKAEKREEKGRWGGEKESENENGEEEEEEKE